MCKTITGLAIGDALGMPFECCKHSDERLLRWDGRFIGPLKNTTRRTLRKGQWTDDTQMAVILARHLLQEGVVNYNLINKYRDWANSGKARGIGKTTAEALSINRVNILSSDIFLTGIKGAEGNGTAMRAAPIGCYFKDPRNVMSWSHADAAITHDSDEAKAGSAVIALAVRHLRDEKPKEELLSFVMAHVSPDLKLYQRLARIPEVLREIKSLPPIPFPKTEPFLGVTEQNLYLHERMGWAKKASVIAKEGIGGHVIETVPTALICFLLSGHFSEAVNLAVRVGGDADTRAAMTGALAGSYYPDQYMVPYLNNLEKSKTLILLDDLLNMADLV